MVKIAQPSFAGGELSPEAQARVDIAKYQVGLAKGYNGIVKQQGGFMNRAGFEFLFPCKYPDREHRKIGFSYNTEQTYSLLFGDQYMWVIKDGGVVLESGTVKNITAITQADPAVFTSVAHGYTNGTWLFVSGIVGMTEFNGRFFKIANATTDTFTLQDQNDNDIDSSAFTAYVSGGTIQKIYEVVTPYAHGDLAKLVHSQSANVMTLTLNGYDPRDLTRTDHDAWTLTVIDFEPDIAAPASLSGTASPASGTDTNTYVVTAESDETGEISYASPTRTLTNDLTTSGNQNTLSWPSVTGADRYNVYKQKNGLFGWIGQSTTLSFVDDNIAPDMTDSPPEPRTPFDGAGNKPAASIYHEQRKIFGGTENKPNVFDGTQIGRYQNMSVSRPTKTDDAFSFGIVASEVQAIRAFVSMSDLLVFTSGGVWKVAAGSASDTIGPDSVTVTQQTEDGISEFVRPLMVGNVALYVHDLGRTVSDIGYNFENDGYRGDDLTILAKHLFEFNFIKEWCWHKEPYRVAWAIRDDGILLALTYVREHQVWAWTRQETAGQFKTGCTIREGNEHAYYAVVKRTVNGQTVQYVERMHSRIFRNIDDAFFVDSGLSLNTFNTGSGTVTLSGGTVIGGTDDEALNWPAGDALTLTEDGTDSPFTADMVGNEVILNTKDSNGVIQERLRTRITAYTSSTVVTVEPLQSVPVSMQGVALVNYAFAMDEITNLWHLEGEEVTVLSDGDVEGPFTVENGTITLQTPAARVAVGLPYYCDMKTLRITGGPQNANTTGVKKAIPFVDILIEKTRGLEVGPNENNLYPFKQRFDEEWGAPTGIETGLIRQYLKSTWAEGQFLIRQSLPLPMTISAVFPEIVGGG